MRSITTLVRKESAEQDDAQGDGQVEVALARLQHDGRGQDTRVLPSMLPPTSMTAPTSEMMPPKPATMATITPTRASVSTATRCLPAGGAQGPHLLVERGVDAQDRGHGEAGHQREGDDGLGHDHGARREELGHQG